MPVSKFPIALTAIQNSCTNQLPRFTPTSFNILPCPSYRLRPYARTNPVQFSIVRGGLLSGFLRHIHKNTAIKMTAITTAAIIPANIYSLPLNFRAETFPHYDIFYLNILLHLRLSVNSEKRCGKTFPHLFHLYYELNYNSVLVWRFKLLQLHTIHHLA